MKNSYKFFENHQCEYYPCHEGVEEINCLFCYCPLYLNPGCLGKYRFIESHGKRIKECTDCIFPHKAENYELIMNILSQL